MQINFDNKVNFTSVVPFKVFIDGRQCITEKSIRAGYQSFINTIAKSEPKSASKLAIIRKFTLQDRDYDVYKASAGGYNKIVREGTQLIKKTPSDFFRLIERNGEYYLISGPQGEALARKGADFGKLKALGARKGILNSFEVEQAKNIYGDYIDKVLASAGLRIREFFNPQTKIYHGKPVSMNINMSGNGKTSKSTFKTTIDNIDFEAIG